MRANLGGGSGSATDTQTYEAESLIAAAKAHATHYQTLRGQFHTLRQAFQQIEGLGSDFQGKGAEAIKHFYAAQVNVVDAWLRLIDKKIAYFQGVAGTIEEKNLGGDTQIQVPFLNEDLSMGYARSKEMVREQRADISKILSSISDLVPINVFSNHEVDQALDAADKKRAQTVLDVQDLDQNLTNEYRQVNEDLPYIASLYGELLNATRQGADVQPMKFNAQAYQDSKIVHVQDEMKKETQNYLQYKQQQETVREMEKQREAEINRPWYQKAGSAVATFAGELSGYYDYLRAVEGVDPETGRKLSAGERIAAGAMAASTFIPIIGWGGRIAKGGAAIYKTARGMEAAGKALNAYDQTSRTLKVLSQSEKGINALLTANGITQAATGRDLFGKQLTKEEQQNSLLQGVFMMNLFTRKLAIAPEQKAIVHEQGDAFKEHVSKIVRDTKASVSSSHWKSAMAGVPDDFAKISDDAEDIAKTHRMAKSESDVAKANQVGKYKIEGLTSSATKGTGNTSNKVKEISEVNYGDHFTKGKRGRKELTPNVRYVTQDGYKYTTDELGRITNVEADNLILQEADRNLGMQRAAGREDRLPDDDGGHLIGSQFHGSGDIDNLVAQNSQINRSGGQWYKMETEWANALKETPPRKVSVKIEPIYLETSLRPDSFEIMYEIEGKGIFEKIIKNKS